MLYDAIFNNVKGCVDISIKLISLFYDQNYLKSNW